MSRNADSERTISIKVSPFSGPRSASRNHGDVSFRALPTDSDWRDGAERAIRRRFGRSASVWSWRLDSTGTDRDGNVTHANYVASIVGKRSAGGAHPVLGEAAYTHRPEIADCHRRHRT